MAIASLFPVYSASSNLAFSAGDGNTLDDLFTHIMYLILGLGLMYLTHRVDYRHFGALSKILLPIVIILLLYTLYQGVNISNASRWIRIPFTNKTFQTSALAWVVLPIYLARYLTLAAPEDLASFRASFLPLIVPILIVCGLVLPANLSTAALIFIASIILLYIGGYALKNIGILLGSGFVLLSIFIAIVLTYPNISNRVGTWKTRVESFVEGNQEENYQVTMAKMAIAEGQYLGKGPGKSVQKNFLPQSNSDFIYAVIVEEFGWIGGILVPFIYVLVLFRILIIADRAPTKFGALVAVGVGIGIMLQAFTNLAVAVNLMPVTGQTLPLISAGGTSIWMTCIALGIILSVSCGRREAETQDLAEHPEPETQSDKTVAHAV